MPRLHFQYLHKPDDDIFSSFEGIAHQCYLMAALNKILLVDAYSVSPVHAYTTCKPQMKQSRAEILCYGKLAP